MANLIFKQQTIPIAFDFHIPKPSLYQDQAGDGFIIISADFYEHNAGIYQYHIKTNTMDLIHKYDNNFSPEYHEQIIDKENHILYIFGGSQEVFAAFNLKTKSMEYNKSNPLCKIGRCPSITFIPSPINEIHAYHHLDGHHGGHLKYKINDKHTVKINESKLENNCISLKFPKLLYIESKKQLMIVGSDNNDKIFHCDIEQHSNQNNYEWKLNELIKMPYSVHRNYFDVIIGFKNVIFTFYFPDSGYSDIYCLDLLNHQWLKSKYKVPEYINSNENMYVVKIGNNAHIFDFNDKHHFKVNLYDLVPTDLIKSQREHYKALIMGYIKKQETDNNLHDIPNVLKTLILHYFPLFN